MLSLDTVSELLAKDRIISLSGKVQPAMVKELQVGIHRLRNRSEDPTLITLWTYGGDLSSSRVISTLLRTFMRGRDVWLAGIGTVQSAGVGIMMAVPKERRLAFAQTTFYVHRESTSVKFKIQGGLDEQDYAVKENTARLAVVQRTYKELRQALSDGTGLSIEKVEELYENPRFLSSQEALELGLISGIL